MRNSKAMIKLSAIVPLWLSQATKISTALFFFLSFQFCFAQKSKQVEIIQASSLEGSKINGVEVRRLVGDVIFKQDNTLMYCDSALFYEITNSIDAYGHIRVEGPDAKLYGETLHYDGNTKSSRVEKNVRMTDGKMVLTTDAMNYDLANEVANYNTGGKVVDNDNVLTSKRGYYYSKDKMVFFKDNVVLVNPKYVMKSDTLKYNTTTSTSFFYGPSTIQSTSKDSGFIYCENGWYNSKTEKSYFSKNAFIQTKENILYGDSILYDRKEAIGRAFRNVMVFDTTQKVIINGDYAYVNEKTNRSLVTGKTMLTKIFDTDSMYLHADTLYATNDTITKQKTYFAFNHVRIFKTDLQGKCDSLVYSSKDSTIYFYSNPVLWSNQNQLNADSISLQLSGNKIQSMKLHVNSFVSSLEDTLRFNQIGGKDMTGYFENNKLYKIKVNGNGQTIYYIRNGKKQLTGVNRAECSNLLIFINESKVQKITLVNKPDATLYPIKELTLQELRLKGFEWLKDKQPKSKEEIFMWK